MKTIDHSSSKILKTKSHPIWQWFWLTFLAVSLAYAWYSFYTPSNDIKWDENITSIQKLNNSSDKNTLLFFTGKWCSPCRIMKREVFANKQIAELINSELIAVSIDIDNPQTKELVSHFEVYRTPTTIIINPEGKIVNYLVGKIEKKKFHEVLKNLETN